MITHTFVNVNNIEYRIEITDIPEGFVTTFVDSNNKYVKDLSKIFRTYEEVTNYINRITTITEINRSA